MFKAIKIFLEKGVPLEEKEINFMKQYKLNADNSSLLDSINKKIQALENKEKSLNARKMLLGDFTTNPSLQIGSHSVFQRTEDKSPNKDKKDDIPAPSTTTNNNNPY